MTRCGKHGALWHVVETPLYKEMITKSLPSETNMPRAIPNNLRALKTVKTCEMSEIIEGRRWCPDDRCTQCMTSAGYGIKVRQNHQSNNIWPKVVSAKEIAMDIVNNDVPPERDEECTRVDPLACLWATSAMRPSDVVAEIIYGGGRGWSGDDSHDSYIRGCESEPEDTTNHAAATMATVGSDISIHANMETDSQEENHAEDDFYQSIDMLTTARAAGGYAYV